MNNAISLKRKEFEQSYLDARFATTEFTLTVTHYKVEKLQFDSFFILKFIEKMKKL